MSTSDPVASLAWFIPPQNAGTLAHDGDDANRIPYPNHKVHMTVIISLFISFVALLGGRLIDF